MSGLIRLHITAEGQTEERFVRRVLQPCLASMNIFVDARSVLTSRDKKAGLTYRGGLIRYEKAKKDIMDWIKQDNNPECRFSTMFDLYALPDDFPGSREAAAIQSPIATALSSCTSLNLKKSMKKWPIAALHLHVANIA